MSDKNFKIWYVFIVVVAFAFLNLILTNGIITSGNWFKWIAIVVNCFVIGMAAWKIVTQHLELEKSKQISDKHEQNNSTI